MSTSEDTQLQITLPRVTQGDSPEAVPLQSSTPVSSLYSITECPSEVVTGPSMMEEIEELLPNPIFKMQEESSTCNSPRRPPLDPMASKEENPPNPGEALLGYPKQPPPSPHGSSQVDLANIMAHSSFSLSHGTPERDTSPTPAITGPLCQPVGQCIAPPRGNEQCNDSSTLCQGHNRHALPVGHIGNRSQSLPK